MTPTTELRKNPHAFKGTISVCLICYKPKADKIHSEEQDQANPQEPVSKPVPVNTGKYNPEEPLQLAKHEHTCTICTKVLVCETDAEILHCKINSPSYTCGKCFHLSPQDREYASWAVYATNIGEPTAKCPGHACSKCGDTWNHTYICGKPADHKALCIKCAEQSTANIFRPTEIEQIAQLSSEVLSGSDKAEIATQNEALCWSLTHDMQTSKLLPDWQEKLHKHIFNQQQLIERHRTGVLNSSKCRVAYQSEEMNTLTPEEREVYERQAKKKQRKAKAEASQTPAKQDSAKPDKQDASKVAYSKLLKSLTDQVRKKRPNLTDDEVLKAAEKRIAILQAEETE